MKLIEMKSGSTVVSVHPNQVPEMEKRGYKTKPEKITFKTKTVETEVKNDVKI